MSIAEEADQLARRANELDEAPLNALQSAAQEIERSWSQSNLGYQANVYYEDFKIPPPGAVFSREWGFEGTFLGSKGNWHPYRAEEVIAQIEDMAGHPDLGGPRAASNAARPLVEPLIQRARSAAAKIPLPHDDYLKENLEELQRISLPTLELLAGALMRTTSGQFMIRDMRAAEGGWQYSGHQATMANVLEIRSPYSVASSLAQVCECLGHHLEGEDTTGTKSVIQLGTKIFIGHGGASAEYLKLGVWLTDLGLAWEVFDRKPTAGMSTKERLVEMLDNAQIAFLLMTPEDENAEGRMNARANVIHEVGLFQGRLGWTKAIVLLEEGCEEFSNIEGVGQIRYPKGNIKAALDEVRQVLVREGIL